MAAAPAEPAVPAQEATPPDSRGGNPDVPDLLEQLRSLGELRDAGYVTDAEFEEIKRRILDGSQ